MSASIVRQAARGGEDLMGQENTHRDAREDKTEDRLGRVEQK